MSCVVATLVFYRHLALLFAIFDHYIQFENLLSGLLVSLRFDNAVIACYEYAGHFCFALK